MFGGVKDLPKAKPRSKKSDTVSAATPVPDDVKTVIKNARNVSKKREPAKAAKERNTKETSATKKPKAPTANTKPEKALKEKKGAPVSYTHLRAHET